MKDLMEELSKHTDEEMDAFAEMPSKAELGVFLDRHRRLMVCEKQLVL